MKVVILAAGKGTRLGDITKEIPKPLIPVAGKPVAEHIISGIAEAGPKEFVLITRHLAQKIKDYFEDGKKFDVNITYATQGDDKYGTAAALMEAEKYINKTDSVMMSFGDIITTNTTYKTLIDIFKTGGCDAVMALNYVDDPWRGGAVYLTDDNAQVTKVVEKPPKGSSVSHWNSAGIFIFKPVIFDYLKQLKPSGRGEYEISDAINMMIDDGKVIYPYFLKGIWRDVGTPEDIIAAEEILANEHKTN